MPVPRIARVPSFWLAAFLAWFVILWNLSAHALPAPPGPKFPGLDKILHFGYYFGGAGLLAAALFLFRERRAGAVSWPALILIVTGIVSAVGLLDEWHQSWVPDRTGNDPGDWLADTLGAFCGALVFRRCHHLLRPQSPDHPIAQQPDPPIS